MGPERGFGATGGPVLQQAFQRGQPVSHAELPAGAGESGAKEGPRGGAPQLTFLILPVCVDVR